MSKKNNVIYPLEIKKSELFPIDKNNNYIPIELI